MANECIHIYLLYNHDVRSSTTRRNKNEREREKNKMKLATNRDLFFYSVLCMSNVSLAFFSQQAFFVVVVVVDNDDDDDVSIVYMGDQETISPSSSRFFLKT